MFDFNNNHENMQIYEAIRVANGPILKEDIKAILKTDGFIYPFHLFHL
jgi:hypothetical protein